METVSGESFKDKSIADGYDDSVSNIFGASYDRYEGDIRDLLNDVNFDNDIVIDLGCGTGISTGLILEKNPSRVIGIDFSDGMLDQARKKYGDQENVTFVFGSAEELRSLVTEEVDKVVSANLFKYLDKPEGVLGEIYTVLKERGEYIFDIGVKSEGALSIETMFYEPLEHALQEVLEKDVKLPVNNPESKYTREEIKNMADRCGFDVVVYSENDHSLTKEQVIAFDKFFIKNIEDALRQESGLGSEKIDEILAKFWGIVENKFNQESYFAGRKAGVVMQKRAA
jgi:ubiquinone/menaquinone biosynthesis C-methylase UbiE